MAPTTIDPFDWQTIVDGIRSGTCIPFLGAAANIKAGTYQGLPLGGEVANKLFALLVGNKKSLTKLAGSEPDPAFADFEDLVRLRTHDLARVALHVQARPGGSRRLLRLLQQILADNNLAPSRLLETLAALPFRLIVTTNYDGLMEEAFRRAKPPADPLVIVQPPGGFTPDEQSRWEAEFGKVIPKEPQPRGHDERPILYKIHGSLGDAGDGVIITEDDYIAFLDAISRGAGVPPLIQQMLVDGHLLCLGYSLEDWDFRTLWKGLVESLPPHQRPGAFALQKDPSRFWERFWAKKEVTIYNVDLYEFADELRQQMKER
jgi:SIR2-like domain